MTSSYDVIIRRWEKKKTISLHGGKGKEGGSGEEFIYGDQ